MNLSRSKITPAGAEKLAKKIKRQEICNSYNKKGFNFLFDR